MTDSAREPDSESPARRPAPSSWKPHWSLSDDVTYLNHGSFGPSPRVVAEARNEWSAKLESQPMDFFIRQMEDALSAARQRLGEFIGAGGNDLIFVDNATYGMNVVAGSVKLEAGDEVLTTDHEYGAVLRIWRRACRRANANLVVRPVVRWSIEPDPDRIGLSESGSVPSLSPDEIAEEFLRNVTDRTRLILLSHVTSPTAIILPVAEICRRARELGVPVCIDGPHALAMLPLDLEAIGCDFYAASCHKWLCAPFGTGFLYVARKHQQSLEPPIMSWGGSVSGRASDWKDEFAWAGTRDPAGFLSVPTAIDFLEAAGIDDFRRSTHELARYARRRITELTGLPAPAPESSECYGSMISLPIPFSGQEPPKQGRRDPLQDALWQQHRIEVPIVHWQQRRFVRVSCHLYNDDGDVDRLVDALAALLG